MTENNKTCTKCNSKLNDEEIESPRKDKDGDIICDDCFEELYMYHCPICQKLFEEDFSKDISPQYFIITKNGEEDFVGDAGTYEIIRYPFYANGMIEFHLIKFAFKKIADLPKFDEDEFYNSIYYICDECVKKQLDHSEETK